MPSSPTRILFPLLLIGGAVAAAQPSGAPGAPPPKQGPAGADDPERDRRGPPPGPRATSHLPDMSPVDLPAMVPLADQHVTASGNFELWAARIAARRRASAPGAPPVDAATTSASH